MKKSVLRNYAKLIVRVGANVRKGQEVWINAELDQPEFIAMVVEECYKAKAKNVVVRWSSDPISKLHYKYQTVEELGKVPSYAYERLKYASENLPVMIYILSEDPDALKGVDQEKVAKAGQLSYPIIKPLRDKMEARYQWTIAAVPGVAWAKKMFPELSKKKAVEKLWELVLKTSRADQNPIQAWKDHNAFLKEKMDKLNSLHLVELQYKSANGTDFKVGLIDKCKFIAGGETNITNGVYYNPNIPSEECFVSPYAGKAEGVVVATKPLSYNGELIENFKIHFKDGKVCKVEAEKNERLLDIMVHLDEGASMLGEVALVPFESPINEVGVLFYNTLFDENAVCHLALGMGFNNCYEGFENMSPEEIKAVGINDSMIHVDFMIGSRDLSIVGITKDGSKIQIFENGTWAI